MIKQPDKDKNISAIPDGVWESSRPKHQENDEIHKKNISTDIQGNGYPDKQGH